MSVLIRILILALILVAILIFAILKRNKSFIKKVLQFEVPIVLLLMLGSLVSLLSTIINHLINYTGWNPTLIYIIHIILAIVLAGSASFSAFVSAKKCFITGLCTSAFVVLYLILLYISYIPFEFYVLFVICVLYTIVLCCLGLRYVNAEPPTIPVTPEEPKVEPQPEVKPIPSPQGIIHFLTGDYAGAEIRLENGEELRIGADPTQCNLMIQAPSITACHCRIRWQNRRNTYWVSNGSGEMTQLNDGSSMMANSTVEVFPGTQFQLGTSNTIIQLGDKERNTNG